MSDLKAITDRVKFLTTDEAAGLVRLKAQTLRKWASYQNGPVMPRRVGRRLLWSETELLALLEGSSK
jgi:hypothetical protein